ncbi:unnamed protein product [Rodentolepis nana]|uniref:Zinc finger CCCH domain-containing protein 6 n=1 Tax=Rodentolepis nana TaxID=102285 RepID=A0A0R3T3Y1_RODNA|nr:unnamed protein product [Rodentolepis nana]
MNSDPDYEEGEVNDLSDFEEGNICCNEAHSPLDSRFCDDSLSSRVRGRNNKRDKYRGLDSRHVDVGRGSPVKYTFDDGLSPRHRATSRGSHAKSNRKRKRRQQDTNSIEKPPPMKKEKLKCRFYMEGRCHKGLECPYSHDFLPAKKKDLCKFYAVGSCSKGPTCPFMHSEFPCKFFHLKNNCYHGNNCKFSHTPLSPDSRAMLERYVDEIEKKKSITVEDPGLVVDQPEYPNDLSSLPITEPNGDVDYRQVVPSGSPVAPNGSQFPLFRGPGPRPPIEPHYFRPYGDGSPQIPPRGYGQPLPYRGPYQPSYGYRPGPPPYPQVRGPHIPPGNRRHPRHQFSYPQRFRPSMFNNGEEDFFNESTMQDDDYRQDTSGPNRQKDQEEHSKSFEASSPQATSTIDQPDIPEMTVSKDNIVCTSNDKLGFREAVATFCWRLIPIEFDFSARQKPPPAANAAPNDPRLKVRPQLPVLINIPNVVSMETKQTEQLVSQPERRKRPKLELNECANPLLTAGMTKPSSTPVAYSRILDPRLIKRQQVEPEKPKSIETSTSASSNNDDDDDSSLTPKPLRLSLSPQRQ